MIFEVHSLDRARRFSSIPGTRLGTICTVGLGLVMVLFATRRGGAVLFPRRGLDASVCANNNEERAAPGGAVRCVCFVSVLFR